MKQLKKIQESIVKYCEREDYEELKHDIEGCKLYFDGYYGCCIVANSFDNDNIMSLFGRDTYKEYIDNEIFTSFIKTLYNDFPVLFSSIQEIIICCSLEDKEYLDEHHNVALNNTFLGQYNYESKVVVVNFKKIIKAICEEFDDLDFFEFRKTIDLQIIQTLIHELSHSVYGLEWLPKEYIPFEYSEDEEDEEDIVEDFCKTITEDYIDNFNLVKFDFAEKLFDGEDSFVDDEEYFFDEEEGDWF